MSVPRRAAPLFSEDQTNSAANAFGAHLEVGDERFDSSEIERLYEAADYPLRKSE